MITRFAALVLLAGSPVDSFSHIVVAPARALGHRLPTRWAVVAEDDASTSNNDDIPAASSPRPKPSTFFEAEQFGLEMFQAADYEGAIDMFTQSLSLKGSGWDLTRARSSSNSPVGGGSNQGGGFVRKEFASKEEVQCAKYNIACCQVWPAADSRSVL